MSARPPGLLRAVAIAGVTCWLAVGAALWAAQAWLIFPGVWALPDDDAAAADRDRYATAAGITQRHLPREDGSRLLLWHRPAEGQRAVVYVHGNGEGVVSAIPLGRALGALGWDLVAMEYAGYPGCDGWPSESRLADDLRTTWRYTTETLGVPPDRVVLHGRSMGGAVVGTLLGEVTPGGWVFESTFDSLATLAWERYPLWPVRWLLRSPFDTVARAPLATAPALSVHSQDDRVVPYDRGAALADALPDVARVTLTGRAHDEPVLLLDDGARFAWHALLRRVAGTAPPR